MTAHILDGKQIAANIKENIRDAISNRTQEGIRPPGLAVILVGQDPASEVYVANKRIACSVVGISSYAYDLPNIISEKKLISLVNELNHNKDIDGILVQLPLPKGINSDKIIECLSPLKDVDGFHPCNMGRLAQRNPYLRPCTPYGIIQLIKAYNLPLSGKHAVVVGASNIVGRPMALEFLLAKATVTVCHRFTKNLEQHIRIADVIVVATGVRDLINPSWLNNNQILIDVGMHRLDNGKLRGDIDFATTNTQVGWITPVPGGVGPMTIATLLQNTLYAATHSNQ